MAHQPITNGVELLSLRHRLQNYLFFWLENSAEDFKKCTESFCREMHTDDHQWKYFDDDRMCRRAIHQTSATQPIVLITAGSLLRNILDDIHPLIQLHSIYIFCRKKGNYEPWRSTHPKIQGIYTIPNEIKQSLCQQIRCGQFFRNSWIPITSTESLQARRIGRITYLDGRELKSFCQPDRCWCPWDDDCWTIRMARPGQGTIEIRQRRVIPFEILLSDHPDLNDDVHEHHMISLQVDTNETNLSLIRYTHKDRQERLVKRQCVLPHEVLQNREGVWYCYWLSFYHRENLIRYGLGEVRPKFEIFQTPFPEAKPWMDRIQYIHLKVPNYINRQESIEKCFRIHLSDEPVLFDPLSIMAPLVDFALTRSVDARGLHGPSLDRPCRDLYEEVKDFNLREEGFPDFIAQIEASLRHEKGWCYRTLRAKLSKLSNCRLDALSIRIQLNRINNRTLEHSCIMEIWPPGHRSPVREFSDTCGFIRILHGKLLMRYFASLALNTAAELRFEQLFEADQVAWMIPNLNQTHQMTHPDTTGSCCIILQAYHAEGNMNAPQAHVNFSTDSSDEISRLYCTFDIDFAAFKEKMREESLYS